MSYLGTTRKILLLFVAAAALASLVMLFYDVFFSGRSASPPRWLSDLVVSLVIYCLMLAPLGLLALGTTFVKDGPVFAVVYALGLLAIVLPGLYGYFDISFLETDGQAGLGFVVIPIYQLVVTTALLVAMLLARLAVRLFKRQ